MRADLDQMFAALRADADAVPLAEPAAPRDRGRRRRRVRIAAAALATAALVAGMAGGGAWLRGGRDAPDPAQPHERTSSIVRPVSFSPLRQVGPGLTVGAPTRIGLTATLGDRAYVGWHQEDGVLKVAALDMTTGRPVWTARPLGRYGDWNGVMALPQAVIVIGEHDDGRSALDYTLFVLDPATGTLRWQREFSINDDDLVFLRDALVLAGRGGGRTVALDWRTGRELWSAPAGADPVLQSFGMRMPAELGGPVGPRGDGFPAGYQQDDRLFQVTVGGNLLVSDGRTGRRLADPRRVTAPGRLDAPMDAILAYDGRIFVASRTVSPYRVRMIELDGPGEPRVIYTAPAGDRSVGSLAPCAAGRICLSEHAGETSDVVAIDVAARSTVWRKTLPRAEALAPSDDRLLVTGIFGSPTLLDVNGERTLDGGPAREPEPGTGFPSAGWVTTGGLLLMQDDGASAEVFGVDAADGRRTSLGRAAVSRASGCSWNDAALVCPTVQGFGVWRFAGP